MGNFISLIIDIVQTSPTPTPSSTPFPTSNVSSEIENVIPTLSEEETSQLLSQAQNIDLSVPFPTASVSNELDNIYENIYENINENNIETFVGDYSYLKNTRTNKISQDILQRNIDSNVLGPNTISK